MSNRLLYVTCVHVSEIICKAHKHKLNWRWNRQDAHFKFGLGCSKKIMVEADNSESEDGGIGGENSTRCGDGYVTRVCDTDDDGNCCQNQVGVAVDTNERGNKTANKSSVVAKSKKHQPNKKRPYAYSSKTNAEKYMNLIKGAKRTWGSTIHAHLAIANERHNKDADYIDALATSSSPCIKRCTIMTLTNTERKQANLDRTARDAARLIVTFTNALKSVYFDGHVNEMKFVCPMPRLTEMPDTNDLYTMCGAIDIIRKTQWRRSAEHSKPWLPATAVSSSFCEETCDDEYDSNQVNVDDFDYGLTIEDIKTHQSVYNLYNHISNSTTAKGEMQVTIYKYALHRIAMSGSYPHDDGKMKRVWLKDQSPYASVEEDVLNQMMRLVKSSPIPLSEAVKNDVYRNQCTLLKARQDNTMTLGMIYDMLFLPCVRHFLPPVDTFEQRCNLQIRHMSQYEFKVHQHQRQLINKQKFGGYDNNDNYEYSDADDETILHLGHVIKVDNCNLDYISQLLTSCDGMTHRCLVDSDPESV